MPTKDLRSRARYALGRREAGDELLDLVSGTTGETYYVDSVSGAAGNEGTSSDNALATIDAAIGKCTANKGDMIVCLPSHSETVSAAGGITCDVAGVTIVGLGGLAQRPQVTLDTSTAATVVMSAADVTWHNFNFYGDIDALVVAFPVTAAGCGFFNCHFGDTGTKNVIDWITLSAAADFFQCVDCSHLGTDTAGGDAFISGAAANKVVIRNLVSNGDFAAANIEMTAAWTDCLIEGCRLQNSNAVDVCIEGFAAATGWLVDNMVFIATNGQLTGINTVGTLALFNNYQVNLGGETGVLIGTVSA